MTGCIVVPDDAGEIERFAASELARYCFGLFGFHARIEPTSRFSRRDGEHVYLLMHPDRCAVEGLRPPRPIRRLAGQAYVLSRTAPDTVWAFGGSGISTLWAVYSLVEQWGVLFSLQGDVLPARPDPRQPQETSVYAPRQELRSWRMMSELWPGPMAWSTAFACSVITQLVKQRYNGVHLDIWPHTPFLDVRVGDIRRERWTFGFGDEVRIDADMPGFELFDGAGRLNHPEIPFELPFAEAQALAARHIRKITDHAKRFDMEVSVGAMLFDLPVELAAALDTPSVVEQAGSLTVSENGPLDSPGHLEAVRANFEAHLQLFPDADNFAIVIPEHPRKVEDFAGAWKQLDARFDLASRFDIESVLGNRAANMLAAGGPDRAEREGKMTLVMLQVLHDILSRTGIATDLASRGRRLTLAAGLSCPSLLPVLSEALWDGGELNIITGYTSSRAVRAIEHLDGFAPRRGTISQTVTLQDDNIGAVVQESSRSIHRLIEFGCENSWRGFVTRFWPIGDLDPMSAVLRQSSWTETNVDSIYETHFSRLCGGNSARSLRMAFGLLEDATVLLDLLHLGLIFPFADYGSRKFAAGRHGSEESLRHIQALYREALQLILRHGSGDTPTRAAGSHLAYHMARIRFSILIIDGLVAIEAGNDALADDRTDQAGGFYDTAIETFQKALEILASHARDESDRASIAIYYESLVRRPRLKVAELLSRT